LNEVLERAGLPDGKDALSIWKLVDIKHRGCLNFGEFSAAVYIAFRRAKQGVPLPAQLPQELLTLATSNISASVPDGPSEQTTFANLIPTDTAAPPMQPIPQASTQSAFDDFLPSNGAMPLVQPTSQLPKGQDSGMGTSTPQTAVDGLPNFLPAESTVPPTQPAPQQSAAQPPQGGSPQGVTANPLEDLQQRIKALGKKDPFEASGCISSSQTGATAAGPSSSAIPTFFQTGSAASDPFDQAMSVKELKSRLTQHGANFTGLSEKCELLALLKKVEAEKKKSASSFPQATSQGPYPANPATSNPTMSTFGVAANTKSPDDPFSGL